LDVVGLGFSSNKKLETALMELDCPSPDSISFCRKYSFRSKTVKEL